MAKKEKYEEPDSEEYEDEEEENELPDVDDDEELAGISNNEQEAMKQLAKLQAQGKTAEYREMRSLFCKKFPDAGLCMTEQYKNAFMAKDK